MITDNVRQHLREALASVSQEEFEGLRSIKVEMKRRISAGVERLRPLVAIIAALKEEVGQVDGLDISVSEHGHMALVSSDEPITSPD